MDKLSFIKSILLASLLMSSLSLSTYAAEIQGDYCNGSLYMRFIPDQHDPAVKNPGTLSVFWASGKVSQCMRGAGLYRIEGDQLSDLGGLRGKINSSDSITITDPSNWVGEWRKQDCKSQYEDPCN